MVSCLRGVLQKKGVAVIEPTLVSPRRSGKSNVNSSPRCRIIRAVRIIQICHTLSFTCLFEVSKNEGGSRISLTAISHLLDGFHQGEEVFVTWCR